MADIPSTPTLGGLVVLGASSLATFGAMYWLHRENDREHKHLQEQLNALNARFTAHEHDYSIHTVRSTVRDLPASRPASLPASRTIPDDARTLRSRVLDEKTLRSPVWVSRTRAA